MYDIPEALATPMRVDLGITESQNLLMYSMYSLPSTVLPFYSAIIISKIGYSKSLFILSSIVVIAHILSSSTTEDK